MNPRTQLILVCILVAVGVVVAGELGRTLAGRGAQVGKPDGRDFSGTLVSGERWSLGENKARGPVVLSFFATWCGPCQMEYPELVKLKRAYEKQHLEVVLITRESKGEVLAVGELGRSPLPILVDGGGIAEQYGVTAIPRTVFYDASGKLAMDVEGYDPSNIREIEKVLGPGG